jgi:erythromycin esterase
MRTFWTILALLPLPALAWGQPDDGAARAAFEKMYAQADAAMARQDAGEVGRMMMPDAFLGIGDVHISLLAWSTGAMKQPGRTSRSEVAEVRVSGETAIVSVRVHITISSNGTKRQSVASYRDTWVRRGDGWAWKECVQTSSRPDVPPTTAEAARPVVDELKLRAHKLATAEAGNGFEDLKAFGDAVGDARIVALGEASHGTREFFQMKHRLLEYLVREKGFTVLAREQNWSDSLAIDRYIKAGEGDPRRQLNFEEEGAMVEWMRAYNRTAAGGKLLTYTGFDMQGVAGAADAALAYLQRYSPQDAPGAEAAYAQARRIDEDHSNLFLPGASQAASLAEAVLAKFDAHRAEWTKASSKEAWRDARQAAAVVVQAGNLRVEAKGLGYRDEMMARNAEWLADAAHPSEKIVLWAHDVHVASDAGRDSRKMGGWLRERFGTELYVVGFAFRRGEVRAVGIESGVGKGYADWPVQASPEGSGDAILSAAGMPLFFLNMTGLPHDGALSGWLAEPHLFHNVTGLVAIGGEDSNLDSSSLPKDFDGLIFMEDTHAARLLAAPAGGR